VRVIFLANYSQADRAWSLWKTGQKRESPEQNLWGATHLPNHDIEVDLLPYEKYSFLKRVGFQLKLGDIDQQLRVLLSLSKYDLIYSCGQAETLLLALLRFLRVLRKPLIVKLERPFKVNFLSKMLLKLFARGHDKILCLSSQVESQLRDEFGISKNKLALLNWGPDLPSYDEFKQGQPLQIDPPLIISAGNTSRDYDVLAKAAEQLNCFVQIYCSKSSAPTLTPLPDNIKVQYNHATATTALSWQDLVAIYEKAYAIVIPLHIPPNRVNSTPLYGLTSLLDAMAMGKAVVMTYHHQANIDVEKEGIGLWVDPGDVNGWQKALSYLLANPNEVQAMGQRARRLAEAKYNLELFASQLANALKSVAN
jgi:glycosyltransferase involved in cell wall biosynthesis